MSMGAMAGSLTAGKLADIFGRRKILLFVCPINIFGWLTISFAPNITCVIIGRTITGLATGALLLAASVFEMISYSVEH